MESLLRNKLQSSDNNAIYYRNIRNEVLLNVGANFPRFRNNSLPLRPGEVVQIALFLPGAGQAVRASGTVVWDDKHGKTGVNFQFGVPRDQSELDAWLNTRFYELLTPRRAIL